MARDVGKENGLPTRPVVMQRLASLSVVTVSCVTACSGISSEPISKAVITHYRGAPAGLTGSSHGPDDGSFAVRISADQVAVTTWGGSSCPDLPTSVRGHGAHEVDIITATQVPGGAGGSCTADLSPTTSTVELPAGIDTAAALTVVLDGKSIALPAR